MWVHKKPDGWFICVIIASSSKNDRFLSQGHLFPWYPKVLIPLVRRRITSIRFPMDRNGSTPFETDVYRFL